MADRVQHFFPVLEDYFLEYREDLQLYAEIFRLKFLYGRALGINGILETQFARKIFEHFFEQFQALLKKYQ